LAFLLEILVKIRFHRPVIVEAAAIVSPHGIPDVPCRALAA
jgi:hypothetical protein